MLSKANPFPSSRCASPGADESHWQCHQRGHGFPCQPHSDADECILGAVCVHRGCRGCSPHPGCHPSACQLLAPIVPSRGSRWPEVSHSSSYLLSPALAGTGGDGWPRAELCQAWRNPQTLWHRGPWGCAPGCCQLRGAWRWLCCCLDLVSIHPRGCCSRNAPSAPSSGHKGRHSGARDGGRVS